MQSDHKEVYRLTALKTGKSEQLYKDIGNFVFTELASMLKKPSSLIVKLKGVGSWHLRKKRMDIVIEEYPHMIKERSREEFTSEIDYNNYLNKKEMYLNFQERLKEYDEYISIRRQVRIKRNENSILLEPDKGED